TLSNVPGKGEHILVVAVCNVSGDERTAGFTRFDHDESIGQSRDNPVTCRKIVRIGLGAQREFTDKSSLGFHTHGNFAMYGWVNHIDTAAKNTHGWKPAVKRLPV